jgi:hypothetical protein
VNFKHPVDKLQHGTTCSNAYIEAATIGLSPAVVTPSQIVVNAATAVALTVSIKSQQSRAPPVVGISSCPVHASTRVGTTACVVDSALLAQPVPHVGWHANASLPCLSPACIPAAGPTLRDIPPGMVSNGLCYLHALAAEDWPRCRHRRWCPCLVGTTMRPLHAAATPSSGSAVEYSHGFNLERALTGNRCTHMGLLGLLHSTHIGVL